MQIVSPRSPLIYGLIFAANRAHVFPPRNCTLVISCNFVLLLVIFIPRVLHGHPAVAPRIERSQVSKPFSRNSWFCNAPWPCSCHFHSTRPCTTIHEENQGRSRWNGHSSPDDLVRRSAAITWSRKVDLAPEKRHRSRKMVTHDHQNIFASISSCIGLRNSI